MNVEIVAVVKDDELYSNELTFPEIVLFQLCYFAHSLLHLCIVNKNHTIVAHEFCRNPSKCIVQYNDNI